MASILSVSTLDDAEEVPTPEEETVSGKKRGGQHGVKFGSNKHHKPQQIGALQSSMRQLGGVTLGAVQTGAHNTLAGGSSQ